MTVKGIVMLMVALVGVLVTIVALGETASSDWSTVAGYVAVPIVLIGMVGIVVGLAWRR